MRAPRSPGGCRFSVTAWRVTSSRNEGWLGSGAHHSVTGPIAAASAVATVRSVNRSCNTAAAWAPIDGIRRVFVRPGIGAFARMATATELALGIAVGSRQLRRIGAEEKAQAQPPHQQHGA